MFMSKTPQLLGEWARKEMSKPMNFVSFVTDHNTPESDKEEFVLHTVRYQVDGGLKEVELMARCPLDATDRVRASLKADL